MADHGKNVLHLLNLISANVYTRAVNVNAAMDVVDTTAAGDSAKTNIAGAYGWTADGDYKWNGSSGQIDHTVYNMLTNGSGLWQVTPAGGTCSADNPMYRGHTVCNSLSISIPHDGIVTCKAAFTGNGALNRYTSGTYLT